MIKTIYIKEFTYKKEKYKFIKPLRIIFHNFLALDCKTQHGEMSIPDTIDGYTQYEPFSEDPKEMEKEAKNYLKTVWEDFVLKQPNQLKNLEEINYRKSWINLLKK